MTNITISITVPDKIITPYYNVFGHFFLDHLFMLYKIGCYLEKKYSCTINNIHISNFNNLKKNNTFIEDFYLALFKNIITEKPLHNCIDIGIVMGSKINTCKNKLYLSHSKLNIDVPNSYLYNGRICNDINKYYGLKMRKKLLDYFIIDTSKTIENEILIVNRKKIRQLLNLNKVIEHLNKHNYKVNICYMENLSIKEQINLIYQYNHVIAACGSTHVHISFMKENTSYIELCETGFRYPNVAIYGNRYNINTYCLCIPLHDKLIKYKSVNDTSKKLNVLFNIYPNIIKNTIKDVNRESIWYSLLLNNCLKYFNIHSCQNIDCEKYIYLIDSII